MLVYRVVTTDTHNYSLHGQRDSHDLHDADPDGEHHGHAAYADLYRHADACVPERHARAVTYSQPAGYPVEVSYDFGDSNSSAPRG